jgi:hypothetical protein
VVGAGNIGNAFGTQAALSGNGASVMSSYLKRLIGRSTGALPVIRPRLPSLYEPMTFRSADGIDRTEGLPEFRHTTPPRREGAPLPPGVNIDKVEETPSVPDGTRHSTKSVVDDERETMNNSARDFHPIPKVRPTGKTEIPQVVSESARDQKGHVVEPPAVAAMPVGSEAIVSNPGDVSIAKREAEPPVTRKIQSRPGKESVEHEQTQIIQDKTQIFMAPIIERELSLHKTNGVDNHDLNLDRNPEQIETKKVHPEIGRNNAAHHDNLPLNTEGKKPFRAGTDSNDTNPLEAKVIADNAGASAGKISYKTNPKIERGISPSILHRCGNAIVPKRLRETDGSRSVNIHIGRIDVRGIVEKPEVSAVKAEAGKNQFTLQEYLESRRNG